MNAGLKWVQTGLVGAMLTFALQTAAEEPAPKPTTPTPPPPAPEVKPAPSPAEAKGQALLEEQAQNDKKIREELAAQSNVHLDAGKKLFAAFDYEAAKQEVELAVQLDRSNEEARKLLIRINDILGVRRDRIRAAVSQLYGEHKVAVQERLIELDNRIDWGKRYINQAQTDPDLSLTDRIRRYEQALAAFERAQELIKWMPVEVNTEEQANEVARLIRETGRAIKAAQVRLEQVDREEALKVIEERHAGEKRARDQKINTLVDQAKALYETGKYEAAIDLANKILELDPTNAEAHTIIATSRDTNHRAKRKWIDEEYREEFTNNRERAERMNIPHKDYLIYPPDWREISQRSSAETHARAEEPWKQEIRKKLSRRVSFEFVDTPLEEAITFLNAMTKVNIILDPKVTAEGGNKTPITLRVQDMEMEQALKWILRLAELEYDLRNQAVYITKAANLQSNVELEIYDVRDLTTEVQDFPGPRIDLGASAQQGQAANPFETRAVGTTIGAQDLQQLIHDKLLPAEFTDPTTSIEEQGGKLVVMQRPEVHEKIRQLLRSFRETQTLQVLSQVRFIDVTDGFLENIGISFTGLDSAPSTGALPNAIYNPRTGFFPAGGGAGPPPPLPTDIQSLPNQFQNFVAHPPYTSATAPITVLHPRLDPNFPVAGNATTGPALAPVGVREQWYSKWFGSPVLAQGLTQNLTRINPLASALGSSISTSPQQGLLFQFRFLQGLQTSAILQAVRKDQTADQLLAPRLMQFNNQRAHILVAQERSYIRDYDISGAVYDPVIGTLLIGTVLELRPTISNDRRYITMDVHPGTAIEITPPQILFITNAGNDVNRGGGTINLPIELPNLELRSINTTVTIPDNGTMLFSGLINDQKFDSKSGIPLLSDLPIIGRFFSTNYKERVRRNLLVLINSRIVLFDEEEAKL